MISRPDTVRARNRSSRSLSTNSQIHEHQGQQLSSTATQSTKSNGPSPTASGTTTPRLSISTNGDNDSIKSGHLAVEGEGAGGNRRRAVSIGSTGSGNSSDTGFSYRYNAQKESDDEDFDEANDILEFRLNEYDDPSIMKSHDETANSGVSTPVVVQHSSAKPSPAFTSGMTQHNDISNDKSVENESAAKPSAHSHQIGMANAFAHLRNDSNKVINIEEDEWQDMKTVGSYDIYDDRGQVVVHRSLTNELENVDNSAAKGYTRVTVDDDVRSITSMDEKADFLFDEDELSRDPLKQLQATKDMLTMGQRIAYVGLSKLVTIAMAQDLAKLKASKKGIKALTASMESQSKWAQQMMIRLYSHMEISPEEQIMIEQLSQHGVIVDDLSPSLKQGAKVANPMANPTAAEKAKKHDDPIDEPTQVDLDPEEEHRELSLQKPEDLQDQQTIEIDVRWTLLCDLFLVLISDSVYDSRSRTMMERVGEALGVTKLEIAQFEKKVTDALEIEEGSVQTWDEQEIMESRRKAALKKKYAYVGLATLGGGLVIGLSAGLLAPVIGAGLAAGFTTIGVTGTGTFLAGAGGAAVVTTAGTVAGASIGSKGMTNRMGHVRTFEFRPLHHNKRVNVIVTVSGWMSGKEDDVRLPFSTVDPIMGDLFSVLWEPEMLQSMGHTINILATEVLVQSIQQVLGQTVLTALMASIQLPMLLSKLSYLLDNPWNVSLDRASSAGLILADSLINRSLGVRPATLVGFSLGARVIHSCLVELARRGAYGLIQDVYIFGAPVVVKQDQFAAARSVVSGKFVNGFSRKDWILGYLFRATSGGLGRVAGLAPVEIVGDVENLDCTELVEGHMGYRKSIPKLLRMSGFEVVSEEFTEIEDPDPEREREKQQELKAELDEARKQMNKEAAELEAQSNKKKFFSWFKPKRKEWWETTEGGRHMGDAEVSTQTGDVMFDLDAIKDEVDNIKNNVATTAESSGGVDHEAIVPGTSDQDKAKEKPTKNDEYEVTVLPNSHPGIEMKDNACDEDDESNSKQ